MEDLDVLSLRPKGPVGTGKLLPSRQTIQALAVALTLIIVALAGFVWSNGKLATATNANQVATASKEQVELQAQRIETELKKLEGAGGSQRLDTIKQIMAARTDWRAVIVAIGRSAPKGVSLGGFNGASPGATAVGAPASSGNTPSAAGGNVITLSGTAPSDRIVQTFIRNLRSHADVIEDVELTSAQNSSTGSTFALSVTIKAIAPLPTATSSAPAATTPASATP
jgi:Tfp pilus assembly protein PilN